MRAVDKDVDRLTDRLTSYKYIHKREVHITDKSIQHSINRLPG